MRKLENLLELEEYIAMMSEGKKDPHSSIDWWGDCIAQVESWICQDRTTAKENFREKARNYALNFLAGIMDLSSVDKDGLIGDIVDEVEKDLKNVTFDSRPLASVAAQVDRNSVQEEPENRFIKLR